jgi:hypothetical protein
MTPPTIAELTQEIDALWHAVACNTAPSVFRAKWRSNPRAALAYCFSLPVIDEYRKRRRDILSWLETAELPREVTEYDPTRGFNGSCMGGSGANGAYIIAGDPPCCEMDPIHFWDQKEKLAFLRRISASRGDLLALGWQVPPVNICASCQARIEAGE